MMIDCIVADDEELLREALVAQLREAWPALEILATADSGPDALEAIATHKPAYAFLDIRMPGMTGLEVAMALPEVSPATLPVFVTAYDQYAVNAFEAGAVDYLLKPVERERLDATVRRLQGRRTPSMDEAERRGAVLDQLNAVNPASVASPLVWITASAGRETKLIMVSDVVCFRANHKYTTVVTAQGDAVIRTSIRELLDRLDPRLFRQVHRSTIVNLAQVVSVIRHDAGNGSLRLKGREETLPVSQGYMSLFRQM